MILKTNFILRNIFLKLKLLETKPICLLSSINRLSTLIYKPNLSIKHSLLETTISTYQPIRIKSKKSHVRKLKLEIRKQFFYKKLL